MEYTESIFIEAKNKYKPGMKVISPMTGKTFKIEKIEETWHKEYIKGFDVKYFFDVVWKNGKWAEIIN